MNLRHEVLRRLRLAAREGLSGEVLAGELSVSRMAVSKHVHALRDEGYVIDSEPGVGYRFVSAPALALPAEVAALVEEPFWVRFEGGPSTGSTNDDAKALAGQGAPQGTVVIAAEQTAGRGRLGREWASPRGGAYISVLLRPPVAPMEVGSLALAIAVGIAWGLEAIGIDALLKWPNDVLVADRKLAGVLLEMSAEGDRIGHVVAGFGLNVTRPTDSVPGAAYVSDNIPDVVPAHVAAAVLDGIARAYTVWLTGRFTALHSEYESRSSLTGAEVTVRDSLGHIRSAGTVFGVDGEGRLLLNTDGGVSAVASGEVTLRDM